MSDTLDLTWTLGDRMAKARDAAGISVLDMARRLGVARNTIGNWEHDRVAPSRAVLLAYHTETKAPMDWFDQAVTQREWPSRNLEWLPVAA